MARCCGGTGTCACKVQAGRNITVTGTGSAQDPFVVGSDVALAVQDSQTFDLGLSGSGTLASPWMLSVAYADTARLTDLPDVNAPYPTDWQVLAWSPVEQAWVPAPPATASPGLVLTGNGLTGDGSPGAPLNVRPDSTKFMRVTAAGVGLTDAGINRLVRIYPDAATRDADTVTPEVNTVSAVNTDPGRLDYWTGSEWQPITNGVQLDIQPGQLLSMSGAYAGGTVTQYVAQVSTTADGSGVFDLIPAAGLLGYAGVLSVHFTPTGGTPFTWMATPSTNRILGTAYRADDGTPYGGLAVTGVVTALLY